jgi:hypothetical protein
MKNQIIFSVINIMLLFYACKDEELLLSKIPYLGNELKIDGYYYKQSSAHFRIFFFYMDGIMTDYVDLSSTDLQQVDDKIPFIYEEIKDDKLRWGVFVINGDIIQYSGWGTSVGGGLPAGKCIGTIENDTTFCITKSINSDGREFERNDVYHFRQFSPKPDSTNNFIK